MENLPFDPPNISYLPWVNAYPEAWRFYLVMYSSQTWKIINTLSNEETRADTEPDPMTWLFAILFTLSASVHSVEHRSKFQQIEYFYDLAGKIEFNIFIAGKRLKFNDIQVPVTSVVENFRQKVNNSMHTCWDNYDPGWYAAAVAYLDDQDDIEFVPLLQPHCKQCALTCAARTFADKVLDSSALDSSMLALENLLCTLRDRYEQSGEIASLRTTFDRIVLYEKNSSSSGSGNDNLYPAEACVPHDQLEALPTLPTEASGTLSTALVLQSEVSKRTEDWLHIDEHSAPATTQRPILKLSHDDMLDEVRNFLINTLLKEGAYLNLNKGEFTLPWSQLRSKLVEWKIEMVNWPEEVPLKDKKKGINGLNSHFVQCLYRAIHDKERPLHFRRIVKTREKRPMGDRDDCEGPSAKRPNFSD